MMLANLRKRTRANPSAIAPLVAAFIAPSVSDFIGFDLAPATASWIGAGIVLGWYTLDHWKSPRSTSPLRGLPYSIPLVLAIILIAAVIWRVMFHGDVFGAIMSSAEVFGLLIVIGGLVAGGACGIARLIEKVRPASIAPDASTEERTKPHRKKKTYWDYVGDMKAGEATGKAYSRSQTSDDDFSVEDLVNDLLNEEDTSPNQAAGGFAGTGSTGGFHSGAQSGFDAAPEPDWAITLGVTRSASYEVVKAAKNRLAMQSHPDRGGDGKAFIAIMRAWEEACRDRGWEN